MSTAKDDALSARRAAAIKLRVNGLSYREIGAQLGVSHVTAYNYVKQELALIREEATEDASEVLAVELRRLDEGIALVGRCIQEGNLAAVDRLVKLVDQRAKLLRLYEPAAAEKAAPATVTIQFVRPEGLEDSGDDPDSTPTE